MNVRESLRAPRGDHEREASEAAGVRGVREDGSPVGCGATLCCDSSPNQHASKHARATGHPVVASSEPGERWLYCYPDDGFAEY